MSKLFIFFIFDIYDIFDIQVYTNQYQDGLSDNVYNYHLIFD